MTCVSRLFQTTSIAGADMKGALAAGAVFVVVLVIAGCVVLPLGVAGRMAGWW